ncbi:MAG: type II secretion system F family protein [Clostridiales bacterium]|nr:type II secretion system F family protein [Clostridiales bacterium]
MKNKKLDNQVMATFTRQLGLVLDSDLPISSGLEIIQSKTKSDRLRTIIISVQGELKNGYSLSESLLKYSDDFTPFVVHMIELGEKSGSLTNVLNQIADTLEKEIEIKSKVKAALSYPIILSLMMLSVIVLLVVKVLPSFSDILSSLGGEMPMFTDWMLNSSKFIGNNIVVILGAILAIVIVYFLYKSTKKGSYAIDKMKFYMPIQKDIVSALVGTKFARNLSVLLKSGFSFSIAMEMLKPIIDNQYMSSLIDEAVIKLKDGEPLSDVVEKFNIFPGVMIRLLSVAQQTGHMDKMLDKVAVEMEKEADLKLENVATVIEPLLIIILSVLIGIILVSVILPIINILNSIG